METITLQFTLTKEDCIKTLRVTTFKRRRFMHIFLVVLVIAVAISQVFIEMNEGAVLWNWLFIAIIILGILYEYILHPILFTRRLEKHERIPVEMTLSADGSGIDSASRLARNKVEWSEFKSVQETEDYFYLTHKGAAQMIEIIPKRAFESEEQAQAFRELAEGKIMQSLEKSKK
jgi:hypothetical protein